MQEFTTTIKGISKGLRPVEMKRGTGLLADSLNLRPTAGGKLVTTDTFRMPPFDDTYGVNTTPVASDLFYIIYESETIESNVLSDVTDLDDSNVHTVVAVNGNELNVGVINKHASGAKFTIDADGRFIFYPSGAFNLAPHATTDVHIAFTFSDGVARVVKQITITIQGV